MILTAGTVLTPTRTHSPGWVQVEADRVRAVGGGRPPTAPDHVFDSGLLVPGYVDIHCHGGGRHAFTAGGPDPVGDARAAAASHHQSGTTSVMASLVTDSIDNLESALRELAPLVRSGDLLGLHLEGPWLSTEQAGAHDPAFLRAPSADDIDRLLDAGAGTVRMVTLAPEVDGALEAVHRLVGRGVTVAVGHTDASYAVTRQAVAAGATVGTHLFNAMRPMHHREPGPALALLEDPAVHVEVIADGIHVHPALVRAVLTAAPDRGLLVSDAISAAGAGDGDYVLGRLPVTVRDGVARLRGSGSIAGSTLTLGAAVRTAVQQGGLAPEQAVRAATVNPAAAVGADDVGSLAAGTYADLLVLDRDLAVTAVLRRGEWLQVP